MERQPDSFAIETRSPEETLQLGERIGKSISDGLVIALIGPLGAGKTQCVKGLARGIGEADARKVTSPTFTLVQEYRGRLTLYHIDAYRLKSAAELAALGFDEMIGSGSVVVVEWADRAPSIIPRDALTIRIEPTGDTSRRFHFAGWKYGPIA
jgi:tRNA threonylcarbamoyladenosine biosynthesis protein TsaE